MELNSILGSNVIRVFNEGESPKVFPPELARAVMDRYKFVKGPVSVADFTNQSMDFEYGHFFDDAVVMKLTIYNSGIWVEAPTTTHELDRFADDLLSFLSERFGIAPTATKVLAVYTSTVVVKMKSGFASLFDRLDPIVRFVRSAVEEAGVEVSDYQVGGFSVWGEGPGLIKPARFSFERRAGEPLESNLFYSQGPFTTEQHLKLLEEVEGLF